MGGKNGAKGYFVLISFPTQYLVCEGPDLSGKTSLIEAIHKETGFQWNIQDRSFLSMLVFAKMYGRETGLLAKGLWKELGCLNNRFVFLAPSLETIMARYRDRGDDIQDEESLVRLVDLFDDHDWIEGFPNVLQLDNSCDELETLEDCVGAVTGWLKTKEEYSLEDISAEVSRFVSVMPTGSADNMRGYEAQLNFTFYDDGDFEESDSDIMFDDEEGEYYREIKEQLLGKIRQEIEGNNEYGEAQGANSRRFVYADDTCISFIQVLFRQGVMDFHAVLRSSNVRKTFHKDLSFLYYLASEVIEHAPEIVAEAPVRSVQFRIELNSAHLVR